MPAKESIQDIFERYISVIWNAIIIVFKGLGNFLLRLVEILGGFFRGLAYFVAACAILLAVVVFGYGFLLQTIGISESATFQSYRENFLKDHLSVIEAPQTIQPTNEAASSEK